LLAWTWACGAQQQTTPTSTPHGTALCPYRRPSRPSHYPTKLRIFKTNASRYWQVRCFIKGRTYTQSLKTTNKQAAISAAKQFFHIKTAEPQSPHTIGKIGHPIPALDAKRHPQPAPAGESMGSPPPGDVPAYALKA